MERRKKGNVHMFVQAGTLTEKTYKAETAAAERPAPAQTTQCPPSGTTGRSTTLGPPAAARPRRRWQPPEHP